MRQKVLFYGLKKSPTDYHTNKTNKFEIRLGKNDKGNWKYSYWLSKANTGYYEIKQMGWVQLNLSNMNHWKEYFVQPNQNGRK